jgi:hypothetical protein
MYMYIYEYMYIYIYIHIHTYTYIYIYLQLHIYIYIGLITWLASLEDDDFVAAKLLTELGTNEKNEENIQYEIGTVKPTACDIPKFRGVYM